MLQAKESQTVETKEIWLNFAAPLLLWQDSTFIWCVDLHCFLIQIFSSSIHVGDVFLARHPNSSMSPRFMKPLRMVSVSASLLSIECDSNAMVLARHLKTSSTSADERVCLIFFVGFFSHAIFPQITNRPQTPSSSAT
jgi:hypothetical protein